MNGLRKPEELTAFFAPGGGLLAYTPKPRSCGQHFVADLPEAQALPSAQGLQSDAAYARLCDPVTGFPWMKALPANIQPGYK